MRGSVSRDYEAETGRAEERHGVASSWRPADCSTVGKHTVHIAPTAWPPVRHNNMYHAPGALPQVVGQMECSGNVQQLTAGQLGLVDHSAAALPALCVPHTWCWFTGCTC
jgi:hypothetical protein